MNEEPDGLISVLRYALVAVFLTRPNGDIIYANDAACVMFGYSPDELREIGRDAIMDLSDPRLKGALEQRARTGSFTGVLSMRRRDQSTFPAEISSAFFDGPDGEIRTSTFVRDISEQERRERDLQRSNQELGAALSEVRRLQGILPICMYCKRIRDDRDYWQQVEDYISSHAEVEFSHGICPSCYAARVQSLLEDVPRK